MKEVIIELMKPSLFQQKLIYYLFRKIQFLFQLKRNKIIEKNSK
jgi:hypothetical protein